MLIRDIRAWHGGTPNLSNDMRAIPNAGFLALAVTKRECHQERVDPSGWTGWYAPRHHKVQGSPIVAPGPAPATKANELIKRLAVIAEARSDDELEIGRIAREANSLMNVDAAGAHMVLGGIAAARADAEKTKHHYRIALQLNNSYMTRMNYSVSLALLEEHEESFDVIRSMLQSQPDDVALLDHAIREALESAALSEALQLCDQRDRVAPNRRNRLADEVRAIAATVAAGSFTEGGVREVLRTLANIQRLEGVRTVRIGITHDLEENSFLYLRGVNASAQAVAALNERLAESIVEHPTLLEDPGMKFVVAFGAVEVDGGNS